MVPVRLHGGLERFAGGGGRDRRVRLPGGARVADLLEHFGHFGGENALVLVDGVPRTPQDGIPEGSAVDIHPVFGGG